MRLVVELGGERYVDAQQWSDTSGIYGHLKSCLHNYILGNFIGYDVKLLFQLLDRQLPPTLFTERTMAVRANRSSAWKDLNSTMGEIECVTNIPAIVRSEAEMAVLISDIVEHLFTKGRVYLTGSKEPSSHELWLGTVD